MVLVFGRHGVYVPYGYLIYPVVQPDAGYANWTSSSITCETLPHCATWWSETYPVVHPAGLKASYMCNGWKKLVECWEWYFFLHSLQCSLIHDRVVLETIDGRNPTVCWISQSCVRVFWSYAWQVSLHWTKLHVSNKEPPLALSPSPPSPSPMCSLGVTIHRTCVHGLLLINQKIEYGWITDWYVARVDDRQQTFSRQSNICSVQCSLP